MTSTEIATRAATTRGEEADAVSLKPGDAIPTENMLVLRNSSDTDATRMSTKHGTILDGYDRAHCHTYGRDAIRWDD